MNITLGWTINLDREARNAFKNFIIRTHNTITWCTVEELKG
jgi:hypothetical protein